MTLTFVIDAESHDVTAEQFRRLLDATVRMMKDASQGGEVVFTVAGLHASAPTIRWKPRATTAKVELDTAFERIAQRLEDGIDLLERDAGMPEWMTEPTAKVLYGAAELLGETAIASVTFSRGGRQRKITRQTYRTLDRVFHETTAALGSIEGVLVTATLNNGPHVTVTDTVHGRGVRCLVEQPALKQAGQWIGETVVVTGRVRRDHLGRPEQVSKAKIEPVPAPPRVTVAEMGGVFQGGPDSTSWLREQRGE